MTDLDGFWFVGWLDVGSTTVAYVGLTLGLL